MSTIDVAQLPRHFDAREAEERWDQEWQQQGLYAYDPSRPREDTFAIDTPPPTVSGSLHVGHVFSYTHTDVMARYQRMRGRNIFYPMGWDDNGLPTERRVQNYYHVRCDPRQPYVSNLTLPDAAAKRGDKEPPLQVSRANFIELCLALTAQDEIAFKSLWRRVGLSVDWRQEYSTIDARCRRAAQFSFLDLYEKGHVYSVESPTMWDVDFQTAVAQAEVEDRPVQGHFHQIRFGVEDSEASFVIATTRPELLAACVGVTAHPEDPRYRPLFGKRAITPLFRVPVPVFPSELADPEKGTGILMVCTFGDATDVRWWREQGLALRQIVGRDGRVLPQAFGAPGWESKDPEAANRYYAQIVGRTLKQARRIMVELLREPAAAACGREAPLVDEPRAVEHAVKFFEKGEQPLEFISTRQWFVRLLDKKAELIEAGARIRWHPEFMGLRYRTWTEGLQFDWCISRQRYFGVPFPVWYRLDERGEPDYNHPILADPASLPVDPLSAAPAGFEESQRDKPLGFTPENDVFDTWFTSSLTPQIASLWPVDADTHARLFPMDLRPQSHEIIRTWAFYTIVKAWLHAGTIPWKHIGISGWVLDPDRKKMSKSKGNVITPIGLLDEYGSDAVRYWSASARLGSDTAFDTNVLKVGKRLVTKLFNAGKFVASLEGGEQPVTRALDISFLCELAAVVEKAGKAMEDFDHATALAETERFFWRCFTDNYLELVKARARDEDDAEGRGSALATLRLSLKVLLRLFAPFLPFITEEIWSWRFAADGPRSVHIAPWPDLEELKAYPPRAEDLLFETAAAAFAAVNRRKSEANVSVGRAMTRAVIVANKKTTELVWHFLPDLARAIRGRNLKIWSNDELADGVFEVAEVEFDRSAEEA